MASVGRPTRVKIDPAEVQHLSTLGCTSEEISAILSPPGKAKIWRDTIEKKYSAEITKGRMLLHRNLKHELVERALSGNTAALIFALKAYCKLSENDQTPERQHLTIHFDYGQARDIESRAVPIREAVSNMLQNYRKDVQETSGPLSLEDSAEPS